MAEATSVVVRFNMPPKVEVHGRLLDEVARGITTHLKEHIEYFKTHPAIVNYCLPNTISSYHLGKGPIQEQIQIENLYSLPNDILTLKPAEISLSEVHFVESGSGSSLPLNCKSVVTTSFTIMFTKTPTASELLGMIPHSMWAVLRYGTIVMLIRNKKKDQSPILMGVSCNLSEGRIYNDGSVCFRFSFHVYCK